MPFKLQIIRTLKYVHTYKSFKNLIYLLQITAVAITHYVKLFIEGAKSKKSAKKIQKLPSFFK